MKEQHRYIRELGIINLSQGGSATLVEVKGTAAWIALGFSGAVIGTFLVDAGHGGSSGKGVGDKSEETYQRRQAL